MNCCSSHYLDAIGEVGPVCVVINSDIDERRESAQHPGHARTQSTIHSLERIGMERVASASG